MTSARLEFHLTLSKLATTNDPPSIQDASFLREVVDGLDAQAYELRNQLQVFEEKLQVVERDCKFFKPMLSPVRRVPLEVLDKIFALLVDMEPFCNYVPARLCLVCRFWRRAALGMPQLWTRVTLDPSVPAFSSEGAVAWLSRSGTFSRSVRVEAKECGREGSCLGKKKCVFSKGTLAEVLVRTPRIQHSAIRCPTPKCSQNLFTSLVSMHSRSRPAPWDEVKSLALLLDWDEGWNRSSAPFLTCLPAALTALRLELPSINCIADTAHNMPVPSGVFKRLTTLHLKCDWGPDAVFGILQHCSHLGEATIDLGAGIDFDEDDDPTHGQGCTFPKLTVFNLRGVQLFALSLLQRLKMPALLEASIIFGRGERWLPGINFDGPLLDLDFPETSSLKCLLRGGYDARPSTLKSLHITNGEFEKEYLVSLLEQLPFLARLTLDNVTFSRTAFTQLSSTNQLPNLKYLSLLNIHTDAEKLTDLQPFVKKRGAQLEVSRCDEGDCICRKS